MVKRRPVQQTGPLIFAQRFTQVSWQPCSSVPSAPPPTSPSLTILPTATPLHHFSLMYFTFYKIISRIHPLVQALNHPVSPTLPRL